MVNATVQSKTRTHQNTHHKTHSDAKYRIVPTNRIYTNLQNIQIIDAIDIETKYAIDRSLFQLTHGEFVILMNIRYNKLLSEQQANRMSNLLNVANLEYQLHYYYLL